MFLSQLMLWNNLLIFIHIEILKIVYWDTGLQVIIFPHFCSTSEIWRVFEIVKSCCLLLVSIKTMQISHFLSYFGLLILYSIDNFYLQKLLLGICQTLIYFISIILLHLLIGILLKGRAIPSLIYSVIVSMWTHDYIILLIIIHYYSYLFYCSNYPRFGHWEPLLTGSCVLWQIPIIFWKHFVIYSLAPQDVWNSFCSSSRMGHFSKGP